MMVHGVILLAALLSETDHAAQKAMPAVDVQKEIIYKKETSVDLSGSNVDGKNQVPPAFFLNKVKNPKAESLLEQRLKFSMKKFNETGF